MHKVEKNVYTQFTSKDNNYALTSITAKVRMYFR